jgi:thiol:disulfide interchange protein
MGFRALTPACSHLVPPGFRCAIALAILGGIPANAPAQAAGLPPPAGDPISVRLVVPPAPVRRGEAFRIDVRFEIAPPYHLYGPKEKLGPPTQVEIEPASGLTFGSPAYPKPREKSLPALGGTLSLYENVLTIPVEAVAASDAAPGGRTLRVKVSYAACTDEVCLRPVNGREVTGTVVLSDAPPAAVPAKLPGGAAPAPSSTAGESLAALLAACVAGGLLSLIMPCVYPLVPITLSFLFKQSGGSRWRGFSLTSVYGMGIIVSFTGLGLLLSILVGARGVIDFAANPWVNLVIALIFLAFALSLFGLFEIVLPAGMMNALTARPQAGLAGAFLLGLSFSVVTFTCTMPIASNLFVLAAGGSPLRAAAGMLVYSATMAAPFFALGLFPAFLRAMPRSGGWMVTAKVTMGFLELMLVVYYAAKSDWGWGIGALTRAVVLALWVSLSAFATVHLFGWFRLRGHEEEEGRPGAGRLASGALAAALGVLLLAGVAGRDLGPIEALLPPSVSAAPESVKESWGNDLDAGLREAKASGRPLFVEFTGFT